MPGDLTLAPAAEDTGSRRWDTLLSRAWEWMVPFGVGTSVFVLAFRNGTYDHTSRNAFAIAVWWLLTLEIALGLTRRRHISKASIVAGAALAGFAAWVAISLIWAPSVEDAVGVVDLDALYLGVFILVTLALGRRSFHGIFGGIYLGIAAVVVLALLSRFFPGLGYGQSQLSALPVTEQRLSFPLGYWNGLAILGGIGMPLALEVASSARRIVTRALALGYVPALGGVLYLTSSRGGVGATAIGLLVYLAVAQQRLLRTWAVVVAGAGSAALVAVLSSRHALIDQPFSAQAASEGRSAFFLALAICVATGLVFAFSQPLALRLSTNLANRIVLVGIVLVVVVGVVAIHPVASLHSFQTQPSVSSTSQSYITQHLLSTSGNGRWQMWTEAVKEYVAHPVIGGGAGSYQGWWEQHRSTLLFVINAHSLYAETLAEFGIVGLLAIVVAVLAGVVSGVRGALRWGGEHGRKLSALVGAFVVFAVGAGTDWIWQIPAVGAIGVALLALLVGGAWQGVARLVPTRSGSQLRPVILKVAAAAVCVLVLLVEAVPLLAGTQLGASQSAARAQDLRRALKSAAAARDLEPWAWSPYLQLALIEEQAGSLRAARADIARAIDRSRSDWQLWIIAARLDTESGKIRSARRALQSAKRLNPLGVTSLETTR